MSDAAVAYNSSKAGHRGALEWAFMSTTSDKAMALGYSGIKQGRPMPTILEIDSGSVDRGADIRKFSQYPGYILLY